MRLSHAMVLNFSRTPCHFSDILVTFHDLNTFQLSASFLQLADCKKFLVSLLGPALMAPRRI